ncbi:MAG: TIGR01777 family protein [Flavobacteriaceae bacterium]|nr:MAG: TIGR01777 family protein [Flavobacteriaceae bacterium]
MVKVLITGGSGLIGKQLLFLLKQKGYEVCILTRTPKSDSEYKWDINEQFIDENAFHKLDYIIHLAGAGIADKRWTEKRKQEIIDSRIKSTELLLQKVKQSKLPLKGFISASAIGYYGAITSKHIFKETDSPANDFIGKVCVLWEQAVLKFNSEHIRTVIFRTGIVLSKNGGVLAKMKTSVISPIGSGKQYVPWIHIDDLCHMYIRAIEDIHMSGIFNAVAPEHQTSSSFSKILAQTGKRPFIAFGVPAILLQLIFGKLAILLLEGSRISSEKITLTGFRFKFPQLKDALKNLAK